MTSDGTPTDAGLSSHPIGERLLHPGSLPPPRRSELEPDPLFDEFWAAYPRKTGKGAARGQWHRTTARNRVKPERIIAAAQRYRDACRERESDPKYIPHPAKWLHDERYNDELLIAPDPIKPTSVAPAQPVVLNDEQLLAAVIRLTANQERPVTAAAAIIRTVLEHAACGIIESFPVVSADRGRELAEMPYKDYLLTPEWQARRLAKLKSAGHRCMVCNGERDLNVHHRTYARRGVEHPSDLTVLCEECHLLFHGKGHLHLPAEDEVA